MDPTRAAAHLVGAQASAMQAAATNASNAMSQKVYNTTLKMYNKMCIRDRP